MRLRYPFAATIAALSLAALAASKAPIPIAEVQRAGPVNFERDVLPVSQRATASPAIARPRRKAGSISSHAN